ITTEGWTGTVTLSQVVFDPQVFASVANAFVYSSYYAADARDKRARLVLDVTSDYLGLLKARLLRDAARSALDRADENLALARARETLGAMSRVEVMRAEVFRSQAEVNLLSTDRARAAANAALLATLGVTEDAVVVPTEELAGPAGLGLSDPDSLLAEIERSNPGARLAARAGTAAALNLAGAVGQALPSVSAYWRSSYADSLFPTSVGRWDGSDNVSWGISLAFPLLDLKSYALNIANASTEARRSRAAAARARLSLRAAAVAAVTGYAEACQRLDYADRNLRLNEELYRLAQVQHRLGALSSLDFYGVETGLQQAQAGRIGALCDTYIQAAQISYLLGRTGLPGPAR
ncbi:TolC family protein, partial [candidate division WOR-3 bacterium]|nr:TolC family protein [candidate division WOR-3 bacterium]